MHNHIKYNTKITLFIILTLVSAQRSFAVDSITALYRAQSDRGIPVFVPGAELSDKRALKDILEKYAILPGYDNFFQGKSEEQWNAATEALIINAEKQDSPREDEISIHDLPKLLADAKSTLISFVPNEPKKDFPIPVDRVENVLKKGSAVGRLLTYNKLRKVIEEYSLKHVRLPIKKLYIKDNITKTYLRGQQAIEVLNDIVKLIAFEINPLQVKIDHESPQEMMEISDNERKFAEEMGVEIEDRRLQPRYEPIVFPEKITNSHKPFNENARRELELLVKEAPFDVGEPRSNALNIFSDENGNAIIIDTEFKGEPADSSVAKLKRGYF